jgi:hypothetical protein
MSAGTDAESQARRAFRRNLAAASSNWRSAELICPSPGCANYVEARWTEAGAEYVFSGMRNQKRMGGGVVMVYAANSYRDGSGPALVSYCFISDGSPTRVQVAACVGADMGWAEPRAREFYDATPANE